MNSGPYDNGFCDEFDCGCFLWEMDDREDVSDGEAWRGRGVFGGDNECGGNGTRKSVGGGTADVTFGQRIERL
jgi:hypothetical protein